MDKYKDAPNSSPFWSGISILSGIVAAILTVFAYELSSRTEERRAAEEIANLKSEVRDHSRTIRRMEEIVDDWDDLKISLLRGGIDTNALEAFIEQYTSKFMTDNRDLFSGPRGEQGPIGLSGIDDEKFEDALRKGITEFIAANSELFRGPPGPKGEDNSRFILYPLDSNDFEVVEIDSESIIRSNSTNFVVRRQFEYSDCGIGAKLRKQSVLTQSAEDAAIDICDLYLPIFSVEDGANFKISGIEINVFSEDETLIRKMENGARYYGGEHEVLFSFKEPTNGEGTIVKAIPGDRIFLADNKNQAVELRFGHIGKRNDDAIYEFYTEFVRLAPKLLE